MPKVVRKPAHGCRPSRVVIGLAAIAFASGATAAGKFGPDNPFYSPSTLPFQAPPFDKIKDQDYQPAIEAGMRRQLAEIRAIAENPAPPTFDNTYVAMERSGRLLERALAAFNGVSQANTDAALQKAKAALAPQLARHEDAIYLNKKLFARISAVYHKRASLRLDPESGRLVQVVYDKFVHSGAQLSGARKTELKRLNEELSTLSESFDAKVLAATKAGAFHTTDRSMLAGLGDARIAAAADAAHARGIAGYLLPLQNTTQQPVLASLANRAVRRQIFEDSWNRAERGDANDTRGIVTRMAQLRARRAQLLGFPNYAAWKLGDQMAKTPQAVLSFMNRLVPVATAQARRDGAALQSLIDAEHGGFKLEPWDWEYYQERLRRQKYDIDEAQVKPYFELNNVLKNGVFYAAHLLYGVTFKERKDIPVYQPDVRVFEVFDEDGKPLALFYCDYFKRDNKSGGAWMSEFVGQSKLLGTLPVVYNVANLPKPAAGEPALISFGDVTTMFHEFGHALNGMFSNVEYPTLSGTARARDFVEFPSQFNEHWALYPAVFEHYARDYRTGAPMPPALVAKLFKAKNFGEGYDLTELLAAAELDMQWHMLPPGAGPQNPDTFEVRALAKTHMDLRDVPPRYRSTYFLHIWASGYSAGYYAYIWTQMLADDGFQWFEDHGGLTRANGERFRRMILSRGQAQDLATMYQDWRGRAPTIDAMMKDRGLLPAVTTQQESATQSWAQLEQYRAADRALPAIEPGRVVFYGDSITEGWGHDLGGAFPGKPYVNRGISGQTTPQMLVRFRQDVVDLHPQAVVILAGTNDIAGNTGPSTLAMIEDNFRSMTEIAKAHGIRVILASVLPAASYPWRPSVTGVAAKIRKLNAWIKSYCAQEKLTYLDYWTAMAGPDGGMKPGISADGVHPNAAGYAIMGPLVEAALAQK